MSENEEIREEKKTCNCDKRELRRFLLTILGSFLGCLVALCLFGAVNKPQSPVVPPCPPCPPRFEAPMPPHHLDCPCMHHRGDFRPDRGHHPERKAPAPHAKKDVRR